jgi:chemotaxis methyl-accepting protein methylase
MAERIVRVTRGFTEALNVHNRGIHNKDEVIQGSIDGRNKTPKELSRDPLMKVCEALAKEYSLGSLRGTDIYRYYDWRTILLNTSLRPTENRNPKQDALAWINTFNNSWLFNAFFNNETNNSGLMYGGRIFNELLEVVLPDLARTRNDSLQITDLCCGVGLSTLSLASTLEYFNQTPEQATNYQITGIDANDKALQFAKKKQYEEGILTEGYSEITKIREDMKSYKQEVQREHPELIQAYNHLIDTMVRPIFITKAGKRTNTLELRSDVGKKVSYQKDNCFELPSIQDASIDIMSSFDFSAGLTDEGQSKFFETIAKKLKPGGYLISDFLPSSRFMDQRFEREYPLTSRMISENFDLVKDPRSNPKSENLTGFLKRKLS